LLIEVSKEMKADALDYSKPAKNFTIRKYAIEHGELAIPGPQLAMIKSASEAQHVMSFPIYLC
jgi:hypothetical protein